MHINSRKSSRNSRKSGWDSRKSSGFTLVELIVAVTILAVVSAIAIPLYTQYSQRTFRAELQADLMNCAQALERFNAVNFTYVGVADAGAAALANGQQPVDAAICPAQSVVQGRYDISVVSAVATYTLTGLPDVNGPMDGDGDVTLNQAGLRTWDEDDDGVMDAIDLDWVEDL